jgi:hypothetical protein
MMGPDLTVAACEQTSKNISGPRIPGDWIGDDVSRPDSVPREQRMQPGQRVDVLELLMRPGVRVPLIVAFGVDADQQIHGWTTHIREMLIVDC